MPEAIRQERQERAIPREDFFIKSIKYLTSLFACISFSTLSKACFTVIPELNKILNACLICFIDSAGILLRSSPTKFKPYIRAGCPSQVENGGISWTTLEQPPIIESLPILTN